MDDDAYMDEAFALAEKGRGGTHPNPRVGAVLVRDAAVVGRGWHLRPGSPHAEAMALAEAGERARGATLYCTLEPCGHQGRTPPCADALVAAGIARAVVALRDPNPAVDGRGFETLRAAGVGVDDGGGRWEARALAQNTPFVKWHAEGLPFVTYKAAVTLDGKVAAAGGDARWISGEGSRRAVHARRAVVDAVMVGAGTVRRDDPELTVRLCEGRDPVRVVVSRSGDLPPEARVLRTARETQTVVVAERVPTDVRKRLTAAGAELIETGGGGLRAGLEALAGRGLLDILCEGGPTLAGALLEGGFIDRVLLYVAPLVVGRGAPDLVATPAVSEVAVAWRLRDLEWGLSGDDLVVSGCPEKGGS